MMRPWNENASCTTDPLWGQSTMDPTRSSRNAEPWCFLCCLGQSVQQTVELPVIWDAKMLIQRACNAFTVCSLFGSNPVVPTYCELDPQKQIPSKFESKYNNFIHKNVWELSSPKCRPCFSLRSGDGHIRLSTGQSMVQLIVCRLRDAKPLSEIRLVYC